MKIRRLKPRRWVGLVMLTAASGLALLAQGPPDTDTEEQNIDTYVNLLRQDIQSQKVAITGLMMALSAEEAGAFWPVYTEYQKELTALGDEKLALIQDYADHYGELSDAKASEIANGALDLETKRTALKRKYLGRFSEALTARKAAKFLQIENQLLMMIDLQVASSLPVVE
jgi:hypothetical protein